MVPISSHVLLALCKALAGHEEAIAWNAFSLHDWQQFALAAQVERIAPLLCFRFRRQGWPEEMPDGVRRLLSAQFYNATANASLIFRELESVLSRLQAKGIEVVLLKGAALGLTLYPDIALRPLGDLDLLVQPSDLDTTLSTIKDMGYVAENPPLRRGLEHLFFPEINFRGGSQTLTHLELHWNLIGGEGSRYRADMNWFRAETRRIHVGSASALVLSPTAHLLHAAMHASLKHGGDNARLLWLYDLHLIITQCPVVDWSQLVAKAKDFHWAPAVNVVFRELRQLFDTPLPAWVLDSLNSEDQEARDLVTRVASRDDSRIIGALNHLAFLDVSLRSRWLAAVIFPDPDYMKWRYKPKHMWLLPACYFVRWSNMAYDGIRTLIGRARIALEKVHT